jgi:hypothetical protein
MVKTKLEAMTSPLLLFSRKSSPFWDSPVAGTVALESKQLLAAMFGRLRLSTALLLGSG